MTTLNKKILALTLATVLCSPTMLIAQEGATEDTVEHVDQKTVEQVSAPDAVTDTLTPEVTETTNDSAVATSSPTTNAVLVQNTAPIEEAVSGDALEGTANPEVATSSESEIVPLVEASTTEPVVEDIPVVEDVAPAIQSEDIPLPPADELTIIADELKSVVETVSKDITPLKNSNESLDPEYVVAISGKTIPTKKQGIVGTSALTTPVATSIDSETGVMTVSGTCASAYYVVLLFKNQTDYDVDPRSFIVNRAYPCENGAYSYSIDRLPTTLANGTYYLMVGEQGESGPWTPASGLTEVSINRTN